MSRHGQPIPSILPQSYNTGRVGRIPTELNTDRDHIRRKRLELKMLQREVAEQPGVEDERLHLVALRSPKVMKKLAGAAAPVALSCAV